MKACGFLSLLAILFLVFNDALSLIRPKHDKVVACYVASWAAYRPKNGKFGINNIRPELCTHIIYAFAGLNETTWTIRSLDPYKDIENGGGDYKRVTELRLKYPELKVSLAIGGWNEGSKNYSELAASPDRRRRFIDSVTTFLGQFNFNGFDLDWEFPGSRGGAQADKQNFVSLVKELRQALSKPDYVLTAAISANKGVIDSAYDIPEISKYLDHIHVMAYDYHGTWNSKVLPNSPLKGQDGLNVEDTINYLLSKGAPPSKLVLGLPMYGRTFILTSKPNSTQESPMNQRSEPEGFKGPYTGQNGFMGYNEICEEIVDNPQSWSTGWDAESNTPYAIKDDHVIVYDNPISMKTKVEYAMKMNLSGVMIWSIDTDDFHGHCAPLGDSLDKTDPTFPLMRSINVVLANSNIPEKKPDDSKKSSSARICFDVTTLTFLAFLSWYA
ncbi:probable chitinase 2 [Hylaeus anthracinus]|uniref:probable chitinase 2 n=1 Tax=Hylaeus anthracinus TaxID=313031 RepID=UPI0023B8C43A|nr:probable chitinase 2 [Hylaeus anthracinus]